MKKKSDGEKEENYRLFYVQKTTDNRLLVGRMSHHIPINDVRYCYRAEQRSR